MPIYEYKCDACNKTFEVLQKINEEPLHSCLYCNGHVEKLVSASSFQFKGSGWYVSDYKNKNNNSSSKTYSSGSTNNINTNSGKDENATIK